MEKAVPPLGKHLILDVWGEVGSLPYWNMDEAAELLKQAAIHAGATILTERWHHFGSGHGYTGVIILAESHISVHTWPEKGYAGIDAFYCGVCDPESSLPAILGFYKPFKHKVSLIQRGE
jgi:S-adenosylmethionine decarboxylase